MICNFEFFCTCVNTKILLLLLLQQEQLARFLPGVKVYGQDGKNKELEDKPPTPGLKYRHYSPNAYVVLFEPIQRRDEQEGGGEEMKDALIKRVRDALSGGQSVGVIHTQRGACLPSDLASIAKEVKDSLGNDNDDHQQKKEKNQTRGNEEQTESKKESSSSSSRRRSLMVYSLGLELEREDTEESREQFAAEVARGLFKALRGLDDRAVDLILVEGIGESHAGCAVMNRLRKAAAEVVPCWLQQ